MGARLDTIYRLGLKELVYAMKQGLERIERAERDGAAARPARKRRAGA